MSKKPVMLCIMDGFGWTPDETYGNAVVAANKPHLDAPVSYTHLDVYKRQTCAGNLPCCAAPSSNSKSALPA